MREFWMAAERVGIFTATMTGLAELCAEEIEGALGQLGFEVERRLMDSLEPEDLAKVEIVVIVSSTYGHGDIPDNGQSLFAALSNRGALTGQQFAVFGLGDRTYADTFCHAGEKWDALLAQTGATRIAPLMRHDAGAGTLAEDEAAGWAAGWAATLRAAA
jgi:MioC protein